MAGSSGWNFNSQQRVMIPEDSSDPASGDIFGSQQSVNDSEQSSSGSYESVSGSQASSHGSFASTPGSQASSAGSFASTPGSQASSAGSFASTPASQASSAGSSVCGQPSSGAFNRSMVINVFGVQPPSYYMAPPCPIPWRVDIAATFPLSSPMHGAPGFYPYQPQVQPRSTGVAPAANGFMDGNRLGGHSGATSARQPACDVSDSDDDDETPEIVEGMNNLQLWK